MSNKPPKFDAFRRMRERSAESPAALEEHPVDSIVSPGVGETLNLPLDQIQQNPDQPRKAFDAEKLQELAASFIEVGQLTPILVKPTGDAGRYLLVAGERRFRAAKLAGFDHLKAIITNGDPEELALIENLQREDLTPIEEATGLARLAKTKAYTQEQLAKVMGRSRRAVGESLALLDLPAFIKADLGRTSAIATKSQLLQVVREKNADKQLALWAALKDGSLSVRAARAARKDPAERPKLHSERFSVNDQRATVTVTFRKSTASDEEVLTALSYAIEAVKRRING